MSTYSVCKHSVERSLTESSASVLHTLSDQNQKAGNARNKTGVFSTIQPPISLQVSQFPCCEVREYSCGRRCGRRLACGNHLCERGCHTIINPTGEQQVLTTEGPYQNHPGHQACYMTRLVCTHLHSLRNQCAIEVFTCNESFSPSSSFSWPRLVRTVWCVRESARDRDPRIVPTPAHFLVTQVQTLAVFLLP